MPELPEVKTIANFLSQKIKNKFLNSIEILNPKFIKEIAAKEFIEKTKNSKIINIENVGKFIVFKLSNNNVILSHLRMEGKYHFNEWENKKHDYLIFNFNDGTKLYYNDTRQFGTFHLRNIDNYLSIAPLSKLASEPDKIDFKILFEKAINKKIPIKSFLLNQSNISGLGNIYVDEVLWATKIHPQTPTGNISEIQFKNIVIASNDIIELATKNKGTTIKSYSFTDNQNGEFQSFLKVHTKINMPCPRCKTKIEKIKVGGRGTYFCPKDQQIV